MCFFIRLCVVVVVAGGVEVRVILESRQAVRCTVDSVHSTRKREKCIPFCFFGVFSFLQRK